MRTRALDKHLRALRGHIRTNGLPRPDRLIVSTVTNTAVIEFSADTALERLTRLTAWAASLTDPFAAWVLLPNGRLVVEATGTGPNELTVSAGVACPLAKLGGHSVDRDGIEWQVGSWDPGMVRLVVDQVVTATVADLRAVAKAAGSVLSKANERRQTGLGAAA